jgi:hypothetical protein
MGNVFDSIKIKKPGHSIFDLSNHHKTTLNMGDLVPVQCIEMLPTDNFQVASEAMFRMMPMVAPIMHKVDITIHHFFVPSRILWENWQKFISPAHPSSTHHVLPFLKNTRAAGANVTEGTLSDYFGIPLGTWGDSSLQETINALPFIAYQMIWYEYYRDQNLQLAAGADLTDSFQDWLQIKDGEQTTDVSRELRVLRKRAWEHDYFTSCLPFPQAGEAVGLPVEVTIDLPVQYVTGTGFAQNLRNVATDTVLSGTDLNPFIQDFSGVTHWDTGSASPGGAFNIDPNGTMKVTGNSSATNTTIEQLREAYALQKYLEKTARGGRRYTEWLLTEFGSVSSDARLQRPEYKGGSKSTMAISEVLQTSSTDSTTPQGNMAGHGISVLGSTGTTNIYAEEHGYMMSILSILPKTEYHQGLNKMWTRRSHFDFMLPDFAQLGEEPVLNKELVLTGDQAHDNELFGYLPRYSDYRYIPSRVSSDFHTTLSFWHMARDFSNIPSLAPKLNADFIVCDATTRIYADTNPSDRHIICHVFNTVSAKRPLPYFGIPAGLI